MSKKNIQFSSIELLESRRMMSSGLPVGLQHFDVNGDGTISYADFMIAINHYKPGNHTRGWENSDIDGNGW